jgi:hypothetical protein
MDVGEDRGVVGGGWSRRRAAAELRHRLADVEREGYTRLEPTRFEPFALTWLDEYAVAQSLKTSTVEGYTCIVKSHLVPDLGREELSAIDVSRVERYVARQRRTLSARTVNRHLNVLGLILKAARREGLTRSNPVAEVDRPRETETEWRVLDPTEVRAVESALRELIAEAEADDEREWRETCRVIFLAVSELGLRRGEVLAAVAAPVACGSGGCDAARGGNVGSRADGRAEVEGGEEDDPDLVEAGRGAVRSSGTVGIRGGGRSRVLLTVPRSACEPEAVRGDVPFGAGEGGDHGLCAAVP